MIKKSTYIRSFTTIQLQQLEKVQQQEKIKTVPEILFFALDNYLDQKTQIEQLKRIIEIKKLNIKERDSKIEFLTSASVMLLGICCRERKRTYEK